MRHHFVPWIAIGAIALAGCSFGPQLRTALPQVRSVPVLANLSPADSLANARLYLASKQYGLAIELFRAASKDPALELDSLNGLAIAYDAIGRADLAGTYFEKALALRSDDPRTRRNLAAFYNASGQVQKREALLADIQSPKHSPPRALAAADDVAAPLQKISSETPGMPQAASAELRNRSPLGGAFRPLLVKASYPGPATTSPSPSAQEGSIICLADPAPEAGDGVAVVRISIGEVFIVSRAAGTTCNLPDSMPAGQKLRTMSNREYLGLVAAYLDQLNRAYNLADLAMSAKASAI